MNAPEIRELRYFLAVAEELHFGRAAERLDIAQPPLSRAVRRLELRLGVRLLERTTRRVALTPAGEVLAEEARTVLAAAEAAARRTQRAAAPRRRLLLALKAEDDGGLLPGILEAYRGEPDAVEVELRLGGWGEQARMLRDGRADVALIYAPFDRHGLDAEALLTEERLAALPAGHRLAGRERLHASELADEQFPRWEGAGAEEIAALWCARDPEAGRGTRPGLPEPRPAAAPGVRDVTELLRLVELGRAVAFVPASVARRHARPELAYVPVEGLTPLTLMVAWPDASRSRATAAFVRAAEAAAQAASRPRLRLAAEAL